MKASVEGNTITIQGASQAVLWLSDELVDLDQEVEVTLGGKTVHSGLIPRRVQDLLLDMDDRFDRLAPAWTRLPLP